MGRCRFINVLKNVRGCGFTANVLLGAAAFAMLPSGSTAAADLPQFTLGLMAEFSGTNAQNGENCRQGFEVARELFAPGDQVPGYELRYVFGDHQGDAKSGISEFRRMVDLAGVQAVILTRSQVGMALNPISRAERIPLLGTVGHPKFTAENPFAFRIYPNVETEGPAAAAAAKDLGMKNIAVISLEDQWTAALETAFVDAFRRGGGEVASEISFEPADTEFRPVITRALAAHPDGLFVNLALGQTGSVIKRVRDLGYRGPIVTNFWGAYPEVIDSAGLENIQGAQYVQVDLAKTKFLSALNARYPGRKPSAVTYCCYAGLRLVLQALAQSATADKDVVAQTLGTIERLELADEVLAVKNREVIYNLKREQIR